MKQLLIIPVLLLTACGGEEYPKKVCNNTVDHTLKVEMYKVCLNKFAEARKGKSYTTHDDEDMDSTINECRVSALRIARKWTCKTADSKDHETKIEAEFFE